MITEIHNMDCMAMMRQYPDKHFDLAVVDPPYGIGVNVNMGRRKGDKKSNYHKYAGMDKEPPSVEFFRELMRVSKNQIIWGANHFISRIPFDSPSWIVWDKDNTGDFADCELAWTSFSSPVRKFKFRWNGMLQEDMANKEKRIHPTQKPVALYDWIFKNYAKEGNLILDTHLGSGSSRIAADRAGLNFVGCELDADYFAAHEKRWNEYKAQLKLL